MEAKAGTNRVVVVARVAWLATFVVPLVLAGLLLAVKAAHAAPSGGAVAPFVLEEEDEGEACEAAEEELEEGEFEGTEVEGICAEAEDQARKKGAAGSGAVAPEECLVRSASARVVAYPSHSRVRLTLGYTTYEPTTATIEYSLTGGRGALHLGSARRQLGRSGVLRLTTNLSDPQMSKVEAAGHFTVRLHSTEAPSSCRPFETEQLTLKSDSKRLVVWTRGN